MLKISFVASRYKELENDDIKKCIEHYFQGYNTELIFYDKDTPKKTTYKMVPNIGREAYAWFDYVIKTWSNPSDYYVFIHPCSFYERQDKFYKLIALCEEFKKCLIDGKEFCGNSRHMHKFNFSYAKKDSWIGNTASNIENVKKQDFTPTEFENIGEWWNQRSGEAIDYSQKQFSIHGLCASSYKKLHSWGPEFWEHVFNDIIKGGPNGEIGHFIERIMLKIAQGKETGTL
jgi:hypothetical protein